VSVALYRHCCFVDGALVRLHFSMLSLTYLLALWILRRPYCRRESPSALLPESALVFRRGDANVSASSMVSLASLSGEDAMIGLGDACVSASSTMPLATMSSGEVSYSFDGRVGRH
jgi:hypothetical protein